MHNVHFCIPQDNCKLRPRRNIEEIQIFNFVSRDHFNLLLQSVALFRFDANDANCEENGVACFRSLVLGDWCSVSHPSSC